MSPLVSSAGTYKTVQLCTALILTQAQSYAWRKRERETNAVDHQFDFDRVVGAGNGVLLYDGRLYSHPPRDRHRNRIVAIDQRPPCSLAPPSCQDAGMFQPSFRFPN